MRRVSIIILILVVLIIAHELYFFLEIRYREEMKDRLKKTTLSPPISFPCPLTPFSERDFLNTSIFNGQWRQDEILFKDFWMFPLKCGGTFVDVGANHGRFKSNTYFFETVLGWNGLCLEANPKIMRDNLKPQRSRCTCLNVGAGNGNETMRFIDYGVLSGFEEYIDKERVQLAMKNSGLDYEEHIIQIPMTRLETIFDIFKIKQVDFMSVDVEGAELQALQGVNFEKVDIFVIISERRKGVEEFLESKGYIRFLKGELDDFFVRKDMISIEKLADVYSRFWTRA